MENENQDVTGNNKPEYKTVIIPFNKYEVKVKLTLDNAFVGIEEISINESFIKFQQEAPKGYHDVDEFYK
jgi:hypothetical protein